MLAAVEAAEFHVQLVAGADDAVGDHPEPLRAQVEPPRAADLLEHAVHAQPAHDELRVHRIARVVAARDHFADARGECGHHFVDRDECFAFPTARSGCACHAVHIDACRSKLQREVNNGCYWTRTRASAREVGYPRNSQASPSRAKKPTMSVTVVAKIVADWAGSKPSDFMTNGTNTPVTHAIVWLMISATPTTTPKATP